MVNGEGLMVHGHLGFMVHDSGLRVNGLGL